MGPARKATAHDRLVCCPGGYSAYVPMPLPPALKWNASLTSRLSDADRAIGRLAGEGRRHPNPRLLIRPFVRREAVLLGVAFTTAQRAIDRLESGDIVTRASDAKRNRVYCARAILDIPEEPSQLTARKKPRPRRGGRSNA